MRFFTPERYIALQDFSTDAVMNDADTAWEDAVERYDEYFRSIEAHLPSEMQRLQSGYHLNDAIVFNMGRQGSRFVIVLQLDTPPKELLVLEYELSGEPYIDESALPDPLRNKRGVQWLFDEIEVTNNPQVMMHSVLLSNGWEVRLAFRDLRVIDTAPLMPLNIPFPSSGANVVIVPT